ncbi:helix-hairpin-helix protein [Lutibacter sp. Hel_I_33_5]|uniref:ComEA family DNA-binding protein n=1 Tax=Lutibacter sp. Hel_I_33_5 TaxID=1566289 RepID=UPI0011A62D1B|nr:helix-hairpin-helix domain-containing protein [Lutibacter sp. Hel_I_33_5]TVZ55698.1 helix-hairpin-helix protein [Lutibacter sp. Hel_I_33_5]
MNLFKSHFWYTKRQRNGIFFLLLLIIVLQLIYVYVDFSTDDLEGVNQPELIAFQKQIDSLKIIELEKRKPKIYPFNPNYITDFKGYQLGMSTEEIDKLHAFRNTNKFINSKNQFQRVTKVSDSLLSVISPYFKFPDWVIKRNLEKKNTKENFISNFKEKKNTKKGEIVKLNINTSTFKEVLKIPEIDYELCRKIFDYRDEVAELQDISELKKIDGFPLEKYERIILYLEAK